MPQMAPLNWLSLFMLFIMIFLTFNMINYYSFIYNQMTLKTKKYKKIKTNWKW
uniref:ATP synthase complex subunit 8 n=1 Tax=Machla sappho TaxID=2841781 RepID=A0A8F3FKY6_9CUCU|nr:ATP synthase F0 subunit 8 [Machla sappho]